MKGDASGPQPDLSASRRFDRDWEDVAAELADDEQADRAGVRHEHASLVDWRSVERVADAVGVLRSVLTRLALGNGGDEPVWCGPGWHRLVAETDRRLGDLDPDYQLAQVKEKFGTLRYYAHPSPELGEAEQQALHRIVAEAETVSGWLCEVCGRADASLRGRPPRRVRTLCDTHADWGVRA